MFDLSQAGMYQRVFLFIGSLYAFLSVAGGAFGAHLLKQKLSIDMLNVFEVGARYLMYHGLAMLAIGIIFGNFSNSWLLWSGLVIALGTLIFSGSLFILALTGQKFWGAVTPFGGTLLLIGWALFMVGLL